MEERLTKNFLEEKLRMVGKALQQLKNDQRIKGFLGPFSFAKRRRGVGFYVTYIDGAKYIGRSLPIAGTPENGQNKNSIRVSFIDSEGSIRRKILESIKRL